MVSTTRLLHQDGICCILVLCQAGRGKVPYYFWQAETRTRRSTLHEARQPHLLSRASLVVVAVGSKPCPVFGLPTIDPPGPPPLHPVAWQFGERRGVLQPSFLISGARTPFGSLCLAARYAAQTFFGPSPARRRRSLFLLHSHVARGRFRLSASHDTISSIFLPRDTSRSEIDGASRHLRRCSPANAA